MSGIGGSEVAVIHMARSLAALGHEVTCIGDHMGYEGNYDGVKYLPFQRLVGSWLECDLMISSRDKKAYRAPVKAQKKIFWSHDLGVGDDWAKDLLNFDRFFCLSNYAKRVFLNYYQHVPEERVYVTRNGIDAERYVRLPPKATEPRFFYSSSPDRGLDVLLYMWPKIREFSPNAELHVFYGFDNWQKAAESMGQRAEILKVAYYRDLVEGKEGKGIFYRGRVGQYTLAQAQLASALWLYPTGFRETYCISALEAQAACAVPVTTALGALTETVKRGVLLSPPNTVVGYREAFVSTVKSFLTDDSPDMTKKLAVMRNEGREWACKQTWVSLAWEWSRYFEQLFEEKKT
jgi:glycosyltransferase involved in cell wall biosynthesis